MVRWCERANGGDKAKKSQGVEWVGGTNGVGLFKGYILGFYGFYGCGGYVDGFTDTVMFFVRLN